jgi:hypothetical protein
MGYGFDKLLHVPKHSFGTEFASGINSLITVDFERNSDTVKEFAGLEKLYVPIPY